MKKFILPAVACGLLLTLNSCEQAREERKERQMEKSAERPPERNTPSSTNR